jgi:hypothetical protein
MIKIINIRVSILLLIFLFVFLSATADETQNNDSAGEKLMTFRGLSIGMDGLEARGKMIEIFRSNWLLTSIDKSSSFCKNYSGGDSNVFKDSMSKGFDIISPPGETSCPSFPGDYGFAIQDKKHYFTGFVSIDQKTNKVIRYSFGGKLTDYIFSAGGISADDFVEQFRTNYNMPSFYWIPHGWQHKSIYGYTIKIMTDKAMDVQYSPKLKFE